MGNFCSTHSEQKLAIKISPAAKTSPRSSASRSASYSSRGGDFNIREFYRLGRVLGSGQFGKVRKATSLFDPTLEMAVKTIEKKKLRNIQTFITEVEMLRMLDHPNIIKIYETFEDQNAYHIVMELCKGKELLLYLSEKGHLEEKIASEVFFKILSVVNYMHKHGVCHRDLKLENFVGIDNENETDVKLIDFGLSKKFGKNKVMETVVGTLYYVAPEVLAGNYGEKCDLWSCGVILHMILSGKMPFNGWDNEDLLNQIRTLKIQFKAKQWETVSEDAKDLCLKLLERDVNIRLSAEQALRHPWLSQATQLPLDLNTVCMQNNFKIKSNLQRKMLYLISRTIKYDHLKVLNNTFLSLDTQKEGCLNFSQVKKGVKKAGWNISKNGVQEYFNSLDLNGDGVIKYSEFLITALFSRLSNNHVLMKEAFSHFSKGNEKIIVKDLKEVLFLVNNFIDDDDDEEIEGELELDNKKELTFDEFQKIILTG